MAAKRGVSTPPPDLQPLEQILYTYLARSASQSKGALDLAKTITANVDKKRTLGAVWSPLLRYVAPSDLETGTRGAAVRLFEPQSIAVSLGIPQSAITDAGATSKEAARGFLQVSAVQVLNGPTRVSYKMGQIA